MRLFPDIEFSSHNLLQAELISLGLVAEDGRGCYLEREELPLACSHWVHANVYPLLDRGEAAVSEVEFTCRLRAFMRSPPEPLIVVNHPGDKFLLQVALTGFRLPRSALAGCGPIPAMRWQVEDSAELVARIERWFEPRPAARRHHALTDARALRNAWVAMYEDG
jgi:hypothetical protein